MKRPRKRAAPGQALIRKLEWAAASLVAAVIAILHFVNWQYVGGLWRDEASVVNLALFPSLKEIWANLEHESFPFLLPLLVHGWDAIGLGGSDPALRVFGLLVGLAILGALWWNAWQFAASPPLVSMLLLGLSGTTIRWGDSLRAYGLGVFLLLFAMGLIWRAVRLPVPRTIIAAMLVSLLAVNALYQAILVLATFCLGGVVVAVRRRDFKRALLVISIGVPAALSLLPYFGVIKRASQYNVITEAPLDLSRIWLVLQRALSDPSPLLFWLWAILLPGAIAAGCILLRTNRKGPAVQDTSDAAWFLLTVLVGVTITYYVFLTALKFPTEVWYYLVWMGVMAVAIDALLARWVRHDWARMLRIAAVVILAAVLAPASWQGARVRMTNVDLAAARLSKEAARGDLIVVHPWFCGVTFNRYYTGGAQWLTLPPLPDYRLHYNTLFKAQMQLEAPIQPVLARVEATLRSGHVVWLVGHYPFSQPPRPPPDMPRAGEGPSGWNQAPYMTAYGMELAYFLQAHAGGSRPLEIELRQAVNPFENFPVRAVTGWGPARF
jgi:hypothetical protein